MKRIIFAILFLLTCASVFGQGSVNTTWRRAADTSISRTSNVRVPVYLKVGRRPDDPFPTYLKTFLAADSVASNDHYIPISGWLSVPIPTTTLQHAIAGEIYYTADTGTMGNNIVGQEISVNVPGRLMFNRSTGHYGIYGLIVNGKPTTTDGHGFMSGNRFVGIYIDLADVAVGQVDSVRMDTTIGLWIPSLDGGRTDSGYVKLGIWSYNNIRTNDSMLAADAIIIGVGTSDSAWVYPDSIKGISQLITKGAVVPIINTRSNTTETGMLRLYGDSAQIRILHTLGATYMQFGDSAFASSDSLYLTGYNSTNLNKFTIRADLIDIRNLQSHTFRWPVTVPNDGDVLAVATGPVPDSGYWKPGGGLDSSTAESYFISEAGDTVPGSRFWDWNYGTHTGLWSLQFAHGGYIHAPGPWPLMIGTDPSDVVGWGGVEFWQNGIERMRVYYDSLDGENRAWIVNMIGAKIDSAWLEFLHAATIHTTDIQGIDTTGPVTLYSELDMNGYPIINCDSLEANRVSADTVRANTYENLPSTLATDVEVSTVVHDSLTTYKYKKASYIDHWNHALADNVWCYEHVKLGANTATPIHALIVDTAGDISAARADTVDAVFEFDAACTVDSVIFRAKTDNAANYITERNIVGPDDSTPDNDSLYQTWTTDWDYTSYSTESILLANPISVLPGETYKLRFIFYHGQDNSTQHVLWAKLGYR